MKKKYKFKFGKKFYLTMFIILVLLALDFVKFKKFSNTFVDYTIITSLLFLLVIIVFINRELFSWIKLNDKSIILKRNLSLSEINYSEIASVNIINYNNTDSEFNLYEQSDFYQSEKLKYEKMQDPLESDESKRTGHRED